jgi:hypothetical protein
MVDTLLDNKVEDRMASSRVVAHDYILEEVDVHGNNESEEVVEDHDACMMALISAAET